MITQARFFRYRTGNTIVHRLPPALKICISFVLAVIAFYLPPKIALAGWILTIIFGFFLHFTVKEILSDLKPAFVYAVLLYFGSVLANTVMFFSQSGNNQSDSQKLNGIADLLYFFTLNKDYIPLLLRLGFSLSVTSILYRTTSNVQFNEGFSSIERFFTRKDTTKFADTISLTLTFIPRIVTNWHLIDDAWRARCGKNNVRKLLTLVPLLFEVSMNHAYHKSLAIENRR